MFDFGFWEIILILMIALVVVGPERLPGLAKTAGLWVGKAKRMVSDIKAEIDQELASEELKKTLNKQNAMSDVYEIIEETRKVSSDLKQEISKPVTTASKTTDSSDQAETATEQKPDQETRANQTLP